MSIGGLILCLTIITALIPVITAMLAAISSIIKGIAKSKNLSNSDKVSTLFKRVK